MKDNNDKRISSRCLERRAGVNTDHVTNSRGMSVKQGGASAAGIDQSIISHQHLMQNISLQRQETIKSWDTPTRGQKTQKHVLSVSRDPTSSWTRTSTGDTNTDPPHGGDSTVTVKEVLQWRYTHGFNIPLVTFCFLLMLQLKRITRRLL